MYQAIFWGFIAGLAVLIGALIGLYAKVSVKVSAAVMAFGAGVLISALSIDLMADAFDQTHNVFAVGSGFLLGALLFVGGDYWIDAKGGHWRKHGHGISEQNKRKAGGNNSGTAILLGTLLDGIPESFVLGAGIASGNTAGLVFVMAVFISNLPEGMSGTMGMKMSGMSNKSILLLWMTTLLVTVLSAFGGYVLLGDAPQAFRAATMAFASGAILAMLCDTMIPEAFKFGGRIVALISVLGFLMAFFLSRM